jgi:hypothetical protein
MAFDVGLNFAPGSQQPTRPQVPGSQVPDAIKVLSLRFPQIMGGQGGIAPSPLMTAPGAGGGFGPTGVVGEHPLVTLLKHLLTGGGPGMAPPQGMPTGMPTGAAGTPGTTPHVTPGLGPSQGPSMPVPTQRPNLPGAPVPTPPSANPTGMANWLGRGGFTGYGSR